MSAEIFCVDLKFFFNIILFYIRCFTGPVGKSWYALYGVYEKGKMRSGEHNDTFLINFKISNIKLISVYNIKNDRN